MKRSPSPFFLRVCSLVLISSLLVGCITAGPNYERPEASLPDGWRPASNTSVSMQEGFALFADEQLLALQTRAIENSPTLQLALLRFAQSRVQQEGVTKQNEPMLRASTNAARIAQSETGSATRLISALGGPGQSASLVDFIADPFSLYKIGFDASWELDLWGGVQRRLEAAQADVDFALANTEQVQLALLSEVARHYFSLRGVQTQLSLLESDIERAQVLLDLMRVLSDTGLGNDFDTLRQESLLAQARSQLPTLLAQQAQSINALSLLLGDAPGSLQGLAQERSAWHFVSAPDLALGLPSEVVDARPDIQAAEARLRSASAQIGAAKAKLYPSIRLGAGLGLESLNISDLGDWGSRQWSIGPQIDLALFDQGQRQTVVYLRELQAQEAAIDYQQVVLKAWHEVDTALTRYSAQRQTHVQLQARLASQEQAYGFARTQFDNGVINYLHVLTMEQAFADARKAASASEAEMAISIVGLFKALGRSDALSSEALAGR